MLFLYLSFRISNYAWSTAVKSMLNHLCAPEAIHIDSSIEMVVHIFPHSFFSCIKELFRIAFSHGIRYKLLRICVVQCFSCVKKCQTILLRINHRLFKILLPKRNTKRKKKTFCYKWKFLFADFVCQFWSSLTKDQHIWNICLYRLLWTKKKQQRQQQETRLNEQTCVYAPCQMDIN